MRDIPVLAVLLMLAACAPSGSADNVRTAKEPSALPTVSYYDRNNDGVADLELHEPGYCDDCDWALVDTDFNGRYEKRVRWSFGLAKEAVDLPVPGNVRLIVGQPPLSGYAD